MAGKRVECPRNLRVMVRFSLEEATELRRCSELYGETMSGILRSCLAAHIKGEHVKSYLTPTEWGKILSTATAEGRPIAEVLAMCARYCIDLADKGCRNNNIKKKQVICS